MLRFDFAVFDESNQIKYLVEFDGRQHYFGTDAKWAESDSLETIQYRDNLKNKYCINKNIILKRIPYTDIKELTLENIESDKWNIKEK